MLTSTVQRVAQSRLTTMHRERLRKPASNGGAMRFASRARWQFADRLERVVVRESGEA